ncbi:MAG: polymorphic toxin-type HINT domain-containing protein, partial [Candidatus Hadarchaeum sp.]
SDNLAAGNYGAAALDLVGVAFNSFQMVRPCFPGDVQVLTRRGWVRWDSLTTHDEVLSLPEDEPEGELAYRPVEEVFQRWGRIWEVRLGGRVLRTTAEHPFWVRGRGWTAARELRVGDALRSHDRQWLPVEGIRDTGREEVVYNCRVAEYHTYFVGDESWGFSVWAHNARCGPELLQRNGIDLHPHALDRLQGRFSRGVTQDRVLNAYNRGRLYYDPPNKRYIRYDPQTSVAVVVTKPSGGRIWTVFEGTPSSRWQHVRWRPGN